MSTDPTRFPPAAPRFFAVVPAAGVGRRFGGAVPKQYLPLGQGTVLERTLSVLLAADWIATVVLVVAPDDDRAAQVCASLSLRYGPRLRIARVGGETRRDSVLAGLVALDADAAPDAADWVLVHDAARPGLAGGDLERLRAELGEDPVGGLLALPVADTVKRADAAAQVVETVPREDLWVAQTPQMFRCGLLQEALQRHASVTDESAAIEACGLQVRLVAGGRRNFKITTAEDLALMTDVLGLARTAGIPDEGNR
jgi:2-C-methyl-D-erythritol 4-phosphate cytidylyltransferase